MPRGGKNSRDALSVTELMIPHNFAGSVIERAQRGIGPQVAVAASPSFRLALDCVVENAEEAAGVDIKKASLRIKARRHPIGRAVGTWFDESAIRTRSGAGFGDRATSRVDA